MMYKWEVPAMTAVIYARYSSDNQREESIEGQIRECTAFNKWCVFLHDFVAHGYASFD